VSTFADALAAGTVVLDGGLATLLESHGEDLTSALWSARLLIEDPDTVRRAHQEYFASGARVAITASYQASFEGFATLGLDRSAAAELMALSVTLAVQARDALQDGVQRWVAASVGPYGAVLADGSEYRGDYGLGVPELRAWHRPRLEVLAAAGPDLLAAETIPCLAEVEAVVGEFAAIGRDGWISLTCAEGRTRAGEPVAEAFAMAKDVPEIVAVGINCTDPREVADLVVAAREATGKPVIVYPNSGEIWHATTRSWSGAADFTADQVAGWIAAGAAAVGGCCRVGPAQIRQIADLLA